MTILERIGSQRVFFDGGTGTILQSLGLQPGELPETWNLSHPDEIRTLYKGYLQAGSHVFNANTFGANRLSVEREPGVICLYPMQSAADSTHIRILEIYASSDAYQQHLQTAHFQKYKQGTMHMVKSLNLPTMRPLDPETMKLIFTKQR